jgi:hypothetical protein
VAQIGYGGCRGVVLNNSQHDCRHEGGNGTRNIACLDESALPLDITILHAHEDEESRVRHWRSISDIVEDAQAHMQLKEGLADQIWERHGASEEF